MRKSVWLGLNYELDNQMVDNDFQTCKTYLKTLLESVGFFNGIIFPI